MNPSKSSSLFRGASWAALTPEGDAHSAWAPQDREEKGWTPPSAWSGFTGFNQMPAKKEGDGG